ncbi:MAG: hypothetical protein WD029_04805 [Microthrixaceae bacterium]
MTLDPSQQAKLQKAKLFSLTRQYRLATQSESIAAVGSSEGPALDDVITAGSLYALLVDGHGFVLLSEASTRALSAALIWAAQQPAQKLTVFTDDRAGELARFASYFQLAEQSIELRWIQGSESRTVPAQSVPEAAAMPQRQALLEQQLLDEGLEVVHEHGVTRGELLGLEVARLVVWPSEFGGDDELHLEVGVGRFDRDAHAAVRPDQSAVEDLSHTVSIIRDHRFPAAPSHAVQRLSRERWLRATLIEQPALVGATELTALGMTSEATGLRDPFPAAALGTAVDGSPLLVVCSCGVDLALVPLAADLREQVNSDASLLLALPMKDHHVATKWLASMLRRPSELIDLAVGWA